MLRILSTSLQKGTGQTSLLLAEALDDVDECFSGGKTLHDFRKKRCQPVCHRVAREQQSLRPWL
ncbi:MAG: hypothetical protein NNA23_00755 [Nitrospira sp.]|nr:hypothetical protein [Nitrospira sp.]